MGTLQGLDGRLLVDTEHNRVFRRAEVQTDDIRDLGRECRISTHSGEVWLDAVGSQDVGHTAAREPDRVAQETGRPPASPGGRGRQRELHDLLNSVGWHGTRRPDFGRSNSPSTPSRTKRRRIRDTASGDRSSRDAMSTSFASRTQENDACAAHQPGWLLRARDKGFQHLLLFTCRSDVVCVCHTRIRSHA